jgi:hypothetical protein
MEDEKYKIAFFDKLQDLYLLYDSTAMMSTIRHFSVFSSNRDILANPL